MNKDRTVTTVPAHSLKKGSVIILSYTELLVKQHPEHFISKAFGYQVEAVLEYLAEVQLDERSGSVKKDGQISKHTWNCNDPVTVLVGGK